MTLPTLAGPRAFARYMLRDGRLQLAPITDGCRALHGAIEAIVFREGRWQVGIVTLAPGVVVPRHRHSRVDSVELLLAGGGRAEVEGRVFGAPRGRFGAGLLRVPRAAWHEGSAGPNGVVYVSFQEWRGEPGFVTEDWQPW